MSTFEGFLQLLESGDPVEAGRLNKQTRRMDENLKYVWDVLKAASIGSTIYARRQVVETEAKVGMVVYFNTSTQKFERALAIAEVNDATGVVSTAASAQAWGIVSTKIDATTADILLYGLATVDISQAVSGALSVGVYYLSGGSPGKLVPQKPPVTAAVLRRLPDGRVFVMPQFVDFIDRHVHYKYDLTCRPAGSHSPPAEGNTHEISDPDTSVPGWLPADHAIFEGNAPVGAVFGYNLAGQPALKAAWPPVPIRNAELLWDKGLSSDSGMMIVQLGREGQCVLDQKGIWWMSNCYGDVPWPTLLDTTGSASGSDSTSYSSTIPECPRAIRMVMQLAFTRVNFATDASVVLSLTSNDARVKIRCYEDPTKAASTGNLSISLDLNLIVKDDQTGYLALKNFNPTTSEFQRGPITEGVYALSSNVSLTGTVVGTREISGVTRTIYQGLVGVTVNPADTKELDVQLVRLDGAEEGSYGTPPVMYLEFIAGDEREYRGKVHIPYDLAIPSPQLALRFSILGRAAGTLPQLTFSGRIVPQPSDGLSTPEDLPVDGDEFSIACTTVATITTNQYVEAVSTPFDVEPGDTVYFTVRRSSSDGYAGAVGVLRQNGVVSSGA